MPGLLTLVALVSASALAQPGVAPQGEMLVRADRLDSCVFTADGSALLICGKGDTPREIRRLAPGDGPQPGEPAWFNEIHFVTWGTAAQPFAEKMLFVRRGSKQGGLWIHDLATQEDVQIRRDPFMGLPPAICADGTVIMAYRWAGRSRRIGLVDRETGKFASIPGKDMSFPALNAGGDKLAFIREGQVWLRDLTVDDPAMDVRLTNGEMQFSWPRWVRGGTRVALCAADENGRGKVGLLDCKTGALTWGVEDVREPRSPDVSPDGKWLAFIARTESKLAEDAVFRARLP